MGSPRLNQPWLAPLCPFSTSYARVLRNSAPPKALAVTLVLANLMLAAAQFAEPVLFGRIIDLLARAQARTAPQWSELMPLLGAWVGFGLFTIVAAVLVALHADRLSHRRRLAVMSAYFDHVLHLPPGFHTDVHSGRLLKIMLEGASSMASLWLSFFRENCASLRRALRPAAAVAVSSTSPLAALLIVLVALFGL